MDPFIWLLLIILLSLIIIDYSFIGKRLSLYLQCIILHLPSAMKFVRFRADFFIVSYKNMRKFL